MKMSVWRHTWIAFHANFSSQTGNKRPHFENNTPLLASEQDIYGQDVQNVIWTARTQKSRKGPVIWEWPIQRIQNCAARLITRTRKYEHITPVLRLLHWLPIRQRTLYKLLVLTYCAVNATAPSYLVQLLHNRTVSRTLRSGSSTDLLSVPPSRTVTHGDRCFSVASPTLWNNLPVSLRTAKCLTQFCSQLKTHLFKVAFT